MATGPVTVTVYFSWWAAQAIRLLLKFARPLSFVFGIGRLEKIVYWITFNGVKVK